MLLLVVGGVGLYAYLRNNAAWREGAAGGDGKRVLGKFDLNAVERIVIKEKETSLTLAKEGERWMVREREYPADFGRIRKTVQDLWQLKPLQRVKVGESQLARLHLLPPGKEEEAGTLVELYAGGEGDKPVAALLLGKKHMKESELFPGDEGFAAGRYLMPYPSAGNPSVSLVSEVFGDLVPKPEMWIDTAFIKPGPIRSVALEGKAPDHHWRLDKTDSTWQLADAKADEKVDAAKVPAFQSLLGSPRLLDVMKPDAKPEGMETRVKIESEDGFAYTLTFGTPDGDKVPVTVAVEAKLATERTPGKDEKPEDKARLDEAFAKKKTELEEKLTREKALAGRVYLLSKTLLDALDKPRAELLEIRTAEAPPSPASSPGAAGGVSGVPGVSSGNGPLVAPRTQEKTGATGAASAAPTATPTAPASTATPADGGKSGSAETP